MDQTALVAVNDADADTPPRLGGYGRCASCGNLKALDGAGRPFPHNRFVYQSAQFRTRRCEGERLPAHRHSADVA